MSDTPRQPARAADFYALLTARGDAADSYDRLCPACRRMAVFVRVARVAGQEWFRCARCGWVTDGRAR